MEKIEEVKNLLAGYNCGACGRENCENMAKAICAGKADPSECLPIEPENIDLIKNLLK